MDSRPYCLNILILWILCGTDCRLLRALAALQHECPRNIMAQYKIELRSTWSPTLYSQQRGPDKWRWNTGIGVSLDAREDPYYNETIRTKLHNFVVKGGLSETVSKLALEDSGVVDTFLLPAMDSNGGETSAVFFADSGHSRVSFMSRMNKKPYWILSVESVNLCHNGQFKNSFEMDLFPFDSRPRPAETSSRSRGSLGSYPGNRDFSIVLPTHIKTTPVNPRRVNVKSFHTHTLVTPWSPSVNPRKTPNYSLASALLGRRQTLVTPALLDSKTWKIGGRSDGSFIYASNTRQAAKAPYYSRTLPELKLSDSPKLSANINSNNLSQVNITTSFIGDPLYLAEFNISSILHPTDTIQTAPSRIRSYSVPTDFKRRTPPDSENEVAIALRLARSVPRSRTADYRYTASPRRGPPATTHAPLRKIGYAKNARTARKNSNPGDFRKTTPETLPRLATVTFTKIASYQLSQLSGLAKRHQRAGKAPLPITINKSQFNAPRRTHSGTGNTRQANERPGRLGDRVSHDGMWPSSSVPVSQLSKLLQSTDRLSGTEILPSSPPASSFVESVPSLFQ